MAGTDEARENETEAGLLAGLLDGVGPAIEAALDALEDDLGALFLAAAEGEPVGAAAEALAALADRLVAAASDWVDASTPAPEPEPDAAELLAEAAEALDAALDLIDGFDDIDAAHLPYADRVRIAERARRAAVALERAARTVEVFAEPLPAAPEGFRTPARRAVEPHPPVADRISTTALDPDRAFVAWSVTAAGFARACEALLADERPTLTLRVYIESADRGPSVTDHAVDTWIGQTTMEIDDRAGGLLVCAIGLAAGGTFAHIARATAVQLPRSQPGPGPVRFARVALGDDGRPRIEATAPPEVSGPAPAPTPGLPLATLFAPPLDADRPEFDR